MKITVYVDILILINFFINYILLKTVVLISKAVYRKKRLILAGFVCSFFSLIIFLKPMNFFVSVGIKSVSLLIMTFIAFGFMNLQRFLKLNFFLMLVAFAFNGIISGIWFFASSENIYYNNSSVYININLFLLTALVCVAYGAIKLSVYFNERRLNQKLIYGVIIEKNKKQVMLKGLMDTGNTLMDPLSGKAIILCEFEKIKLIFPPNLRRSLQEMQEGVSNDWEEFLAWNFRFIPFNDYSSCGIIPAFAPDKIIIKNGDKKVLPENILVGLRFKSFEKEYNVLLNGQMTL